MGKFDPLGSRVRKALEAPAGPTSPPPDPYEGQLHLEGAGDGLRCWRHGRGSWSPYEPTHSELANLQVIAKAHLLETYESLGKGLANALRKALGDGSLVEVRVSLEAMAYDITAGVVVDVRRVTTVRADKVYVEVQARVTDEDLQKHTVNQFKFKEWMRNQAEEIRLAAVQAHEQGRKKTAALNWSQVVTDELAVEPTAPRAGAGIGGWYEATGRAVGPLSAATARAIASDGAGPVEDTDRMRRLRNEANEELRRRQERTAIEILERDSARRSGDGEGAVAEGVADRGQDP